ncbi:MAG: hypothetical protein ACE5JP_02535 [Candidatus Bipolaricaulia bacterium]
MTFNKEVARHNQEYEFVAPGHPLLEALNETILREFRQDSTHYAVFTDPEGKREGALWFVEGIVQDGTGAAAGKRVFCLLQDTEDEIHELSPAVLWDLEPVSDMDVPDSIAERMSDRDVIEDHIVAQVLLPYRDNIAERRERDAQIKERYGLRSLDYLIQESNQKLLDYQARAEAGESMEIAIRNERRNLEQLEQRRKDLKTEIRLERNLTIDEPKIIGVAAVLAHPLSVKPSEIDERSDSRPTNGKRRATSGRTTGSTW